MNVRHLFLMLVLPMMLLFVGCTGGDKKAASDEAVSMLDEATKQKDFKQMLTLADSMEKAHLLSEGESYYWQGYAYYRMMQRRTAEFYWKASLDATENSTNEEDLATYAKSASYLVSSYIRYLNFTSALKVVKSALDHLERQHYTASSDYINLLIFEGCCQVRFNPQDSTINTLFEHAYQLHMDIIGKEPTKESYHNAVAGIINIAYGLLSEKQYEQGLAWSERFGKIVEEYQRQYSDDEAYVDKQTARCQVFSAICLKGIGDQEKAGKAFAAYQQTHFAHTSEGRLNASDYFAMSGHWKEASDYLRDLDKFLAIGQSGTSLEEMQKYLLKKYEANVKAGLRDSANAVANQICERLDSAIVRAQREDAEEQETIRQKEDQILQQQQRLSRDRIIGLTVAIIALTVFFIIFTIVRHRASKRLAKVNAAKERMEGELSIARDLQMSMVPRVFPKYEGLDMYASMTPAKEVGGDLYGYLLQEDVLYFCLGDVSGKGVPASLFMAQTMRLFHILASQGMPPAEICSQMNIEMSEDNEQGMFVTLFVCRLNMKSCLLEYCNAGHNPPVIGNADGQFSFLDVLPNAPIGLWTELEYKGESVEHFKNHLLLLYTDGLNEAENPQQEQFGDDHIIEILTSLSSRKAQDVVEALTTEVNRHRDGAEPNDDLTMLCMKLV